MSTIYTESPSLRSAPYSAPSPVKSPFWLIVEDLRLVFDFRTSLPGIILPLMPWQSGRLDELDPSYPNLRDLFLQSLLLLAQASFILLTLLCLLLLILCILLPIFIPPTILYFCIVSIYCPIFVVGNFLICRLLDGAQDEPLQMGISPNARLPDESEKWFFINGISTGKHWLQSNLDRLAMTFQREITGIQNPTKGILFDLIECLIQRDLNYATSDIRRGRAHLRAALDSPSVHKVVLLLHSQGGIEGAAIIDWLLSTAASPSLAKLEVYTFGNAARHFNNPLRLPSPPPPTPDGSAQHPLLPAPDPAPERIIRHIEHYANTGDFVAQIGVLRFAPRGARQRDPRTPFCGAVFERPATGHLLNQHYLDPMFAMSEGVVAEGNAFMDAWVEAGVGDDGEGRARCGDGVAKKPLVQVKTLSRLWGYRNGGTPGV
ncbi:hypothetical protein MMC13_001545 [Lambiella insularis]|nr:hypothetical protein [Lambiella insularis]